MDRVRLFEDRPSGGAFVSMRYAMKTYGGVDIQIHVLLSCALVGGEWTISRPSHFTPGESATVTHCVGGGPGLELQPVRRPSYTQSLYRLSYPASLH
jgi:hypothetical protein